MKELLLILSILCVVPYMGTAQKLTKEEEKMEERMKEKAEIYLAGGCFWGTEHFLKQINGIMNTEVGYANGKTENPSYQEVCKNNTGHAETVKVQYNPEEVSLKTILELFFMTIDPTSLNKQGGDRGTQYRAGIYFADENDLQTIQHELSLLAKKYTQPIVVEVKSLENFYKAEDYHQDYLDKNEGGYCHINPALFDFARKANAKSAYQKPEKTQLQQQLTKLQFQVTQENATEPPFNNEYFDEFREGIYVDITTGEPLFVSTDKFESGCGWPAFSKPIDKKLVVENLDTTYGMTRTEVRSKTGEAHLGHVFTDGPKEKGGLRYCINSASLRFIPKEKMKDAGYEKFLNLLKKQ